MNILFDTNVLLDVFLQREPFYTESSSLLGRAERGDIEGWICGTTVTTIHYLLNKAMTRDNADHHTKNVLKIFNVTNINRGVLENALDSDFKDFEDAVLYQSAVQSGLNGILTRNEKDFRMGDLPIYSPGEFLNMTGGQ